MLFGGGGLIGLGISKKKHNVYFALRFQSASTTVAQRKKSPR